MAGPEGKFHVSMFLYLFSRCLIKLGKFFQALLTVLGLGRIQRTASRRKGYL